MASFGLGRLKRGRSKSGTLRIGSGSDASHLDDFLATRTGVEAYVEPRTTVTDTTILLVAHDGEWTRRRVDGPRGAEAFAKKHALPLYDAAVVGYPQRKREYDQRQKRPS